MINPFLHFCFQPNVNEKFLSPIKASLDGFRDIKKYYKNTKDNVEQGSNVLKSAFKTLIEKHSDKKYIIPLSGGLDSRFILATLVKNGLRNKIITITYGTPGTYDYEIAKDIASYARVKHITIDIEQDIINEEALKFTCDTGGAYTCLSRSYYSRIPYKLFGDEYYYWTGFLSNVLIGNQYDQGASNLSWGEALEFFALKNQWNARDNIGLITHPDFKIEHSLPHSPFIEDASLISYPEQLDLAIKQTSWLEKGMANYSPNIITPFTSPDWILFTLAQPNSKRQGSQIGKEIFKYSHPDYFSLPVTEKKGRPLIENLSFLSLKSVLKYKLRKFNQHNPGANYLAYEKSYTQKKDLINLAESALDYFIKDNSLHWIDLKKLRNVLGKNLEYPYQYTVESLVSLYYSQKFSSQL